MKLNYLRNFTLFFDGQGYAGKVEDYTPPVLATKTEEFRGGGMDAPIDIDLGQEIMKVSWKLLEYSEAALTTWGLTVGSRKNLTFRGSLMTANGAIPIIDNLRVAVRKVDEGTLSSGQKSSISYEATVLSLKRQMNGKTLWDIDVENHVRIIGGVDQLAKEREHLGI